MPFWPVVASSTSSTSVTGACFSTTRLILPSSSISPDLVCSRPAVSTTTVSTSPSTPGAHRLEGHRRRVAALAAADGEDADPLAPGLQLVGGGGAERVGGAEDDALAVADEHAGDLADRRRLAGAVDADHEDHARAARRAGRCRACGPGRGRGRRSARRPAARAGRRPEAVASTIDLVRSRSTIWVVAPDADVGGEEDLLELLPVVLGELLAGEHGEQPAAERGLRAGQPRAQPDQPAGRRRRGLEDQARLGLGGRQLDRPAAASGCDRRPAGRPARWPARRAGPAGRGRVSVVPAAASSSRRAVRRPRPTSRETPAISATTRIAIAISTNSMPRSLPARARRVREAVGHAVRPEPRPRSSLGPLLRHVDPVSATVWVETDRRLRGRRPRPPVADVLRRRPPLRAGPGRGPRAGQHARPTRCTWTARQVWPPEQSSFPPSRIRTPGDRGRVPHRLRLLPLRDPGHGGGRRPASRRTRWTATPTAMAGQPEDEWPDALVLLGDQVYADELTPADPPVAVAAPRRGGRRRTPRWRTSRSTPGSTRSPGAIPQVRWLLSTVPSSMIFDDHEMIDDWNTSAAWRREITAQPWWRGPDQRRPGQLLGLPAPGQPQPAGAGREQDLAGDPGPRRRLRRRRADAARDGRARRHRAGEHPLELRAALGRRPADHDRQPRRPGARRAAAADGRRRRVRLDRGGDAAARPPRACST